VTGAIDEFISESEDGLWNVSTVGAHLVWSTGNQGWIQSSCIFGGWFNIFVSISWDETIKLYDSKT
jgi:hypothetical protein